MPSDQNKTAVVRSRLEQPSSPLTSPLEPPPLPPRLTSGGPINLVPSVAADYDHCNQLTTRPPMDTQPKYPQSPRVSPGGTTANESTVLPSSNPTSPNVIGHYELKKTIGKGNFSTVKLARHAITGHSVAIKIVKTEPNKQQCTDTDAHKKELLKKLNREIEILQKLDKHDNIVCLYQVIKMRRYYMLVTEYCTDGELFDYIVAKGKLSESKSCYYFLQLISAIEFLHDNNIVHRDLKAENLLLTNDYKTIKIADFGFANYYTKDKLLSTWCGSPPYAAPELFKGLEYIGPPADIWSLGVVLYVLVCGSLPFDGNNLLHLKARVINGRFYIPFFMSTECEQLIRGLLRKKPENRFSINSIRSHPWVRKFQESACDGDSKCHELQEQPVMMDTSATSQARSLDHTSGEIDIVTKSESDSDPMSTRGRSLDLDEDKKGSITIIAKDDTSMVCSGISASEATNGRSLNRVKNISSKMQNLVNMDIANAVSNMSLDSDSSMSVCRSADAASSQHSSCFSNGSSVKYAQRSDSGSRSRESQLIKELSIDEQIIDYMISCLKIAKSSSEVRQAVSNDRFGNLHAIYRLLSDQPAVMLEAQAEVDPFKMPSLPLISTCKTQEITKPSITTGFFDRLDVSVNEIADNFSIHHSVINDANSLPNPIHMSTSVEKPISQPTSVKLDKSNAIDVQIWSQPPQLFLTPPTETRFGQTAVSQIYDQTVESSNETNTLGQSGRECEHSIRFADPESSIHEVSNKSDDSHKAILGGQLSQASRRGFCDSSILDNLVVFTPASRRQNESTVSNNHPQNTLNFNAAIRPQLMGQNFPSTGTNLPQTSGQVWAPDLMTYGPDFVDLGAQVMTNQPNVLSQFNVVDLRLLKNSTAQFTPNNLLNQNINVLNNFPIQADLNNIKMKNLELLDPKGIATGYERRASDGQASYASLNNYVSIDTRQDMDDKSMAQFLNLDRLKHLSSASHVHNQPFLSFSSSQISSAQDQKVFSITSQEGCATCNSISDSSGSNLVLDCSDSINDSSLVFTDSSFDSRHMQTSNCPAEDDQSSPLDLSSAKKDINLEIFFKNSANFQNQATIGITHGNENPSKVLGLIHGDVSAPSSATTSPRSSLFSSTECQVSGQVSPSTLVDGGYGHLACRKKRHSLETASRSHYYNPQHSSNSYTRVANRARQGRNSIQDQRVQK